MRALLRMPPKQHEDMKVGKPKPARRRRLRRASGKN